MTVDRQCASGLMVVAIAVKQIIADGMQLTVGGGVEPISLAQNDHRHGYRAYDPWLLDHGHDIYVSMLETAENVAQRFDVSSEVQDNYALQPLRRTAAARERGLFKEEIVLFGGPRHVPGEAPDSPDSAAFTLDLDLDEGNPPSTTLVRLAARRGLIPLVTYRGVAVAVCEPDQMGIGPVFDVPRLLQRHGMSVEDVDLWEVNEAFASQAVYCRPRPGSIPRSTTCTGAIAIGHPYGMSGARMVSHAPLEGPATRCPLRGRHHVHRRRNGCRRTLRAVTAGPRTEQRTP